MIAGARFGGKSVWISGAAGGIGKVTAQLFAREGARLTLVDLDVKAGKALANEFQDQSVGAIFVEADVSVEKQVVASIEEAVSKWGALDIAFNNAGIQFENTPLADSETDDFDRIMSVNTRSVYLCMKHQIRQMLRQGSGHIINTSSAAGLIAAPMRSAYTASKHAVVGLTKAAAVEYGKQNIHINAICPSVVDTDMFREAMAGDPEGKAIMEATIPVGRAGRPEEIAATVAFLATDESRFIQGHGLPVDGGYLAI